MTTNRDRVLARHYEKYSSTQTGVWHVRGEDPNCDWGGPHVMPSLGYFSGTLDEVLTLAMELPGFWQWGFGGDVSLVEVTEAKAIMAEKAKRQAALDKLTDEEKELLGLK